MLLFWWQRLPLLLLVQLLEPNYLSYKLHTDGLLICKSTAPSPQQTSSRFGRFPCLRTWAYVNCYQPEDVNVVSLIPGISYISLPSRLIQFFSFAPNFIPSNSPIQSQEKLSKSRNRRIAASVGGENGVPTLTPLQAGDKKPRKQTIAAIIGGASAALLVVIILVLVYICLMRVKRLMRRTSETASSMPSPTVELGRVNTSHYADAPSPQNLRQLTMSELEHATQNFSQSNIIGEGRFGLVYKGLLQDGAIVAIKRCLNTRHHCFLHEVKQIAQVNHKHLVKLVGYCGNSHQQFLVYDYIPNGNVGNHLYDSEGSPTGKLNMRQRLLIALGAAKGLEYLHSLAPPLLHMHFKSSNVLLDENITAKVSNYGLSKLVSEDRLHASSSAIDCFLDPELYSSKKFSVQSDVYSFGVFLLELASGREAHCRDQSNPEPSLIMQAMENNNLVEFVDETLGDKSMSGAKQVVELALQCLDISPRRPSMKRIVQDLERIQEKEIGRLHLELGEEIGAVTLGSELFK
ncbi:PREDICTED: probable serine/threonine-protein kinase NAK isoform X1 [Theobroma cacao]|uniref:non-specific serine/threonine protein kinase n=1 Tax=Theobroma cacao TaxID=3641 RepID=A0AB32WQH1_THECC|nr:PREDICTED: probable serine/threonine-protein kinase NAK isoform X1 [Theobroma cacao]XP_017981994.1 PREDICTED: probable serine/threonine-protein kinase NAK isoform X1 [Theobroma cacao]